MSIHTATFYMVCVSCFASGMSLFALAVLMYKLQQAQAEINSLRGRLDRFTNKFKKLVKEF